MHLKDIGSITMKKGDLVIMRSQAYFEQWTGKTAIVSNSYTKYNQNILDICFIETGEVRLGMSASLFDLMSESP